MMSLACVGFEVNMRVWVRLVAKAFCCAQVVKALSALYLGSTEYIMAIARQQQCTLYVHYTLYNRVADPSIRKVECTGKSVLTTCSTIQVFVHCSVAAAP